MSKVDDIEILDDIELGDVVGGVAKKKVAKKKVAKKKVKRKRVLAVTPGGNEVLVPIQATLNGKGLTGPS